MIYDSITKTLIVFIPNDLVKQFDSINIDKINVTSNLKDHSEELENAHLIILVDEKLGKSRIVKNRKGPSN